MVFFIAYANCLQFNFDAKKSYVSIFNCRNVSEIRKKVAQSTMPYYIWLCQVNFMKAVKLFISKQIKKERFHYHQSKRTHKHKLSPFMLISSLIKNQFIKIKDLFTSIHNASSNSQMIYIQNIKLKYIHEADSII